MVTNFTLSHSSQLPLAKGVGKKRTYDHQLEHQPELQVASANEAGPRPSKKRRSTLPNPPSSDGNS
jgi:hypothetical protein